MRNNNSDPQPGNSRPRGILGRLGAWGARLEAQADERDALDRAWDERIARGPQLPPRPPVDPEAEKARREEDFRESFRGLQSGVEEIREQDGLLQTIRARAEQERQHRQHEQ